MARAMKRSGVLIAFALMALMVQLAGGQTERHGRKYKAPEPTAHVVVTVIKGSTGKPIHNAAVVFHSSKNDKDEGNLEVKTNEEGKAIIDVIPLGSKLTLQVIADGFATFGEDYDLGTDTTREIIVKLEKPKGQYSTYQQTNDQPDATKPGVQEPAPPSAPGASQAPASAKQPK